MLYIVYTTGNYDSFAGYYVKETHLFYDLDAAFKFYNERSAKEFNVFLTMQYTVE